MISTVGISKLINLMHSELFCTNQFFIRSATVINKYLQSYQILYQMLLKAFIQQYWDGRNEAGWEFLTAIFLFSVPQY